VIWDIQGFYAKIVGLLMEKNTINREAKLVRNAIKKSP